MTKDKALKIINDLIDDEVEAINGYNKAIDDFKDSPMLVNRLGEIYQQETRHLSELQDMKKCIERHDENVKVAANVFGIGDALEDGIKLEEEK